MNYNGKIFRAISNTDNGETSADTIFHYKQEGNIISAHYSGGRIITGHLLGLVNEVGELDFRYHQLNVTGELMTGRCRSTPEQLPTGKLRLHETWQWTSGDHAAGKSVIEEI